MIRAARAPSSPSDPLWNRPTSAPRQFRPPRCPHEDCPAHRPGSRLFRYHKHGHFTRDALPRRIPRFRCLACGRTFSTQTFAASYYCKRPDILSRVARYLTNGAADRPGRRILAPDPRYAPHRDVGAAASTVSRLVSRLGRHCILVKNELRAPLARARPARLTTCVADDFETFAATQLNAVSVATVVDQRSAFIVALDQAAHRRGGLRTPAQHDAERRLEEAGQLPDPAARAHAWTRVAEHLHRDAPGAPPLVLHDGDPTLADALRRQGLPARAYPNPTRGPKGSPRSAAARQRDAAMREIDLLHRLFRHALAHDRRESIAFARSVNALLQRKFIFAVAHDLIQPRRERRRHEGTPAMLLGLAAAPLSWEDLLERRRFLADGPPLPPGWADAYHERIRTLGRAPSARRRPQFAGTPR